MASDFAISRFKYIVRLLLVHGHWNYDRLARMILYFFYKNATFVFAYFWFQLYCGFSGAVMIDQMYLMLYNLLFTSLPPVAIGKIFIVQLLDLGLNEFSFGVIFQYEFVSSRMLYRVIIQVVS